MQEEERRREQERVAAARSTPAEAPATSREAYRMRFRTVFPLILGS